MSIIACKGPKSDMKYEVWISNPESVRDIIYLNEYGDTVRMDSIAGDTTVIIEWEQRGEQKQYINVVLNEETTPGMCMVDIKLYKDGEVIVNAMGYEAKIEGNY